MYFITSVSKTDTRCVGYFSDKETAIEAVECNAGDLYEAGCYPYVVIEHVPEGLYQYDFEPIWFTYIEKTDRYQISPPPLFIRKQRTVGYGIG